MDKVLQLYGGKQINPKDLDLDDIDIESIAHSLSLQTRFLGHCLYHYSTAQHSVYVSNLAPPEHKLCALLHDAPEAILVDLPSLMKALSEFSYYKLVEKYVWSVIAYKYTLPLRIPDIIKQIDKAILYWEAKVLMRNNDGSLNHHWIDYASYTIGLQPIVIEQWSPEKAKRVFLDTFTGLINERTRRNNK